MLTIGFQDPSSTERIADFGVEHTKSQTRSLSCLAFLLFLKASGVNLREGVPWHNTLQAVQSSLKAGFYTTTADSGMERLVMSGACKGCAARQCSSPVVGSGCCLATKMCAIPEGK